jgi:SAM-dependent methyltransferase
MRTDSLRIATKHYYWKPSKAFFHSLELEEYALAGVRFKHPLMDLGCGNGIFSAMLQERGVLDSVDVAVDYSAKSLSHVKKNVACWAIQADANALPFKADSFASVFANDAVSSVTPGVDQVLREVYRILVDGGSFVLAVPTVWSDEAQLIPRILRKVGASRLAKRYLERRNRRLTDRHIFDENGWLKKLDEANFRVEQVRYYFSPGQAFWANFFALWFFRVFAICKIVKGSWIKRIGMVVQEKMFRKLFVKEQTISQAQRQDRAGYIFIVARRQLPILIHWFLSTFAPEVLTVAS